MKRKLEFFPCSEFSEVKSWTKRKNIDSSPISEFQIPAAIVIVGIPIALAEVDVKKQ